MYHHECITSLFVLQFEISPRPWINRVATLKNSSGRLDSISPYSPLRARYSELIRNHWCINVCFTLNVKTSTSLTNRRFNVACAYNARPMRVFQERIVSSVGIPGRKEQPLDRAYLELGNDSRKNRTPLLRYPARRTSPRNLEGELSREESSMIRTDKDIRVRAAEDPHYPRWNIWKIWKIFENKENKKYAVLRRKWKIQYIGEEK